MRKHKICITCLLTLILVVMVSTITYAEDNLSIDFFDLFESHGSIMLLIDGETGEIVFANEAAQQFYGYDEDKFESIKIQDIIILKEDEVLSEMAQGTEGLVNEITFNHQLSDGEIRIVNVHSYPKFIDGHEYLFSIIFDITDSVAISERKEALKKIINTIMVLGISVLTLFCIVLYASLKRAKDANLRIAESEKKLLILIEHTKGVVYRCKENKAWTMEYLSEGCFELTGYKPEELLGDEVVRFVDIVLEKYKNLMQFQHNPKYEHKYEIKTKDGSVKWILDRGYTLYSENDEAIAQEGVLIDITSIKNLELEKDWIEEGTILSQLGKFEWNLSDNMVKCSKTMYEIIEVDTSIERINRDFLRSFFHPDDIETINTIIHHAMKSLEVYDLEYRLLLKDGEIKWIHEKGYFLSDKANVPYANLGTLQDITESKILKEKLFEQMQIAEKANAAKSEFLSNMSHEIRTPLNAIVGFTDLTLKTNLTPQQNNYLKKVKNSSNTLANLIGDILDVAKLEVDAIELETIPFDLEELINHVANQSSLASSKKGLELLVNINDNVPYQLIGDPLRLKQILANLLSNAVKFTDEGVIILNAEWIKNGGTKTIIRFSVSDTGIGITEEQKNNLFQSFSQAETSTTRRYGGTGLGLYISKKLVKLMEGDIWIESEVGKGSTFYFTAQFDVSSKEKFSEFKNAFKMWGMRVLVVEGNVLSRKIINDILSKMSFDVQTCASGEEAIELLKKPEDHIEYELVIIADKLNELDGIELSKEIKGLYSSKKGPAIILLYDYNSFELLGVAEKSRMAATLQKPITPSVLLDTILKVFGKEGFEQGGKALNKEIDMQYLSELRNLRVLLVEDNEINKEVAQEILQGAGMIVTVASDGKQAVDMVKSNTYDVVLMDIQMPVMNGYDAARAIRRDSANSELPIIAMTANALSSGRDKCFEAGMNGFVTKPIDTKDLFKQINRLVASRVNKVTLGTREESNLQDETIQALDGIEVESALNRLGGNQKLYKQLLKKFREKHKHAIDEINHDIEKNDYKGAEILTHTVKGAAGNLGAQEVYLAASNLEAELKVLKSDKLEMFVNDLNQALIIVMNSIATLEHDSEVKERKPKTNKTNVADLLSQLEGLVQLIAEHDLDALEYFESLVSEIDDTSLSSAIIEMKETLEQYDFEKAKHNLDTIINKLVKQTGD